MYDFVVHPKCECSYTQCRKANHQANTDLAGLEMAKYCLYWHCLKSQQRLYLTMVGFFFRILFSHYCRSVSSRTSNMFSCRYKILVSYIHAAGPERGNLHLQHWKGDRYALVVFTNHSVVRLTLLYKPCRYSRKGSHSAMAMFGQHHM